MTTRIILLADLLIIPILAAANDLRAMPQFMDRLDEAKGFRDEIPAYFFLNQFQSYAHQNTVAEVLYDFEIPFLKTKFRNRVAFGEASAMGSGAAEWRPHPPETGCSWLGRRKRAQRRFCSRH